MSDFIVNITEIIEDVNITAVPINEIVLVNFIVGDDATNNLLRSDSTLIESVKIPSNTVVDTTIDDSIVSLINSQATVISTSNIKADSAANITAVDETYEVIINGVTIKTGSYPYKGNSTININAN